MKSRVICAFVVAAFTLKPAIGWASQEEDPTPTEKSSTEGSPPPLLTEEEEDPPPMKKSSIQQPRPIRQGFGLGVILGEPMGLTGKFFISRHHGLQFHAAWDFTDSAFDLIVDYAYHADLFVLDTATVELPLYFGGGLKLGNEVGQVTARVFLGIRAVIGVAAQFTELPLEVFAEFAPVLRVTPVTGFDVDGGAGVRYYF